MRPNPFGIEFDGPFSTLRGFFQFVGVASSSAGIDLILLIAAGYLPYSE